MIGMAGGGKEPNPDHSRNLDFAHPLSVAALPTHATSLRAYRQVLGDTTVLAGTATGTTVGYAEASLLEEGATYEVWPVGPQREGNGASGEHFRVTG